MFLTKQFDLLIKRFMPLKSKHASQAIAWSIQPIVLDSISHVLPFKNGIGQYTCLSCLKYASSIVT